jgi:hypothetical protein
MKHLSLEWGAFLGGLDAWERLTPVDREVFLGLAPSRPAKKSDLGGSLTPLLRAGLIVPVGDGRRVQIARPFLPLHRGLQGIALVPLFTKPDEAALQSYLDRHFSMADCGKLIAQWSRYPTRQLTAERIASVDWLEDFRRATDPLAWEKKRSGGSDLLCFADPLVAPALRTVIEHLLAADSPRPCKDLLRDLPRLPRPVLGKALYAGLRYLLLFPTLLVDLVPVVGLWPPLVRRLRQAAPAAAPIEPEETCPAGFFVEDMIAVLAACTVEPQRVRTQDLALFARAREALAELLSPLPDWVQEVYSSSPLHRAERAAWILTRLDLLNVGYDEMKRPQLVPSHEGSRWLGLSPKLRLRYVLDDLRKGMSLESQRSRIPHIPFLPYDSSFYANQDFDEAKAVVATFADLRPGVFYDLAAFFRHRSEVRNPLVDLSRSGKSHYWLPSSREHLQQMWMRRLLEFLGQRLLLVGGVELGWKEKRACFAITEVGLYLLGVAADFEVAAEVPAEVVVQPNFDIVFLSPSITTEAALARFAQRRGTGVGTLFRITKSAILGAAAAGMTAEQALATLRQAASKGVPDNVAREITGWFGQTRKITVRPAVLFHCPDVEAARRVLTAGGKNVAPLTETVVELLEPKGKTALLRKLREVGVFLGEPRDA